MIYGLTNSKGGVGKTTIAVHLAAWISRKKRPVLFIDADPQRSASPWIKEIAPKVKVETHESPKTIVERLAEVPDGTDVVIDGPAGLSTTTRSIMLRADRVFLPCGPSVLDLRAGTKAVQLLREAQKARKGVLTGFVIPNKLQRRGRLSREMIRAAERLGVPVLSGLTLRQSFADAAGQGKAVWEMGLLAKPAAIEMEILLEEMTGE